MADRIVLKMTKHFGANVPGEVCTFSESTALHILEHKGGEKLAELKAGEIYDVEAKKVLAKK